MIINYPVREKNDWLDKIWTQKKAFWIKDCGFCVCERAVGLLWLLSEIELWDSLISFCALRPDFVICSPGTWENPLSQRCVPGVRAANPGSCLSGRHFTRTHRTVVTMLERYKIRSIWDVAKNATPTDLEKCQLGPLLSAGVWFAADLNCFPAKWLYNFTKTLSLKWFDAEVRGGRVPALMSLCRGRCEEFFITVMTLNWII